MFHVNVSMKLIPLMDIQSPELMAKLK